MDLAGVIARIRTELAGIAALGDERTSATAERIATLLDATVSIQLIELISQVAGEISGQLPHGRVEVRLLGQGVELIFVDEDPPAADAQDFELNARITLRLPEALKARIEEAAAREGLSVNAWLIRALPRLIAGERRANFGRRMSGYGRA